ncbi:MAG TPA: TIR domain-containing protein [Ktedonobacterales bacterium]|nr:TIR domain-containing protein [Ktedonobacterales bacterium]
MAGEPLSIFISYSRDDSIFVDELESDLKDHGFFVWVDRRKMEGGQNFRSEIKKAIDRCRVILVVLSPEAMESKYVRQEYEYADGQDKHIIPLNWQTTTELFFGLDGIHWIDFQNSYDQGLADLLNALSRLEMASPTTTKSRPSSSSTNGKPASEPRRPLRGSSAPNYASASYDYPSYRDTEVSDPFEAPATSSYGSLRKRGALSRRGTLLFPTWLYAFCLLSGVGSSVGMLSQSWPGAVGAVAALALISYALGYHRELKLAEARNIILISEALALGITLFLSIFQYGQTYPGDSTDPLWFYIFLSIVLGTSAGAIEGFAISAMSTGSSFVAMYLDAEGVRQRAAWIFLITLIVWLLLTLFFAIAMFGRGPGWGIPILTGSVVTFVGGVGLITSGYICWKTLIS